MSDRTVRNWLTRAVDDVVRGGIRLCTYLSPHIFRHSFAMYMLYNHVPPKVLQLLLGHEKFESTEVYTEVFALDVAAG